MGCNALGEAAVWGAKPAHQEIPLNAGALRGMVHAPAITKVWAAAGSTSALALSSRRRPSPPAPSGGPHHSAANAVSKRKPLPLPQIAPRKSQKKGPPSGRPLVYRIKSVLSVNCSRFVL